MKYTAYLFCAPGMDRPCFSHTPPNPEQKKAFAVDGTKVYELELDIPTFELIDGKLRPVVSRMP